MIWCFYDSTRQTGGGGRGENSQEGGREGDGGWQIIKAKMKELGCFPLTEKQTYMKLTMSRMVEMPFCPPPAECSPSLMY